MFQPNSWTQRAVFFACITLFGGGLQSSPLTAEELRIEAAHKAMPGLSSVLQDQQAASIRAWQQAEEFAGLQQQVRLSGDQLWQAAKHQVTASSLDDRGLYWARLALTRYLRQQTLGFPLTDNQRLALIESLEHSSRGRLDLAYDKSIEKKILITGFDPFLLDTNIRQSNPSGVLALYLDGAIIEHNGLRAEINSMIFPVRYADFDAGEVESALAPYYALNDVHMVITISMGRTEFDLERFPGRRRSASAPDNLTILAGGSETQPVIPRLGREALQGPEFVQFSLPYAAMQQATGKYPINDRHQVTTLDGTFDAHSLDQLRWATAVRGSGGGYLSNEISYRSIRLRNKLGSTIPTGHLHTPRMPEFDKAMLDAVLAQVESMLRLSLPEI